MMPEKRMTWGRFKELVDAAPDVSDDTPIGYIDIGGMMLEEETLRVGVDGGYLEIL